LRSASAGVGLVLGAVLAASAPGCGYGVVRSGQLPGGGALRVLAFTNKTAQAEAGGIFAAAARELLAARGRLAAEDELAAPVLEGELLSLANAPSILGAAGAGAFRLSASLHLRVLRGTAVLYDEVASGGEEYLQGIDVLGTEANRRTALRRAAGSVLRDALERMEIASLAPPPPASGK
jgi:hypothetical protein